jgi:hypothetical protein
MRPTTIIVGGFLALSLATASNAQMGIDIFKKPSITKAFNPVVGKGAEYETASKTGGKSRSMQMGIVGKDSVDGKDAYWFEIVNSENNGQLMIAKTLITPGDFQPHKAIIQIPGQGAMEMPVNMTARNRQQVDDKMNEWHNVGTDTITVPAGTFSCDHWKNDKDGSEAWTSSKVVPFGLVKEVEKDSSMTLVKVIDDFPDQIKGPVQQFNMQQMMQQMQQQRQQPNP